MTAEQTLVTNAADILEQRGHTKGVREDLMGRVCAIGALSVAATGKSSSRIFPDETNALSAAVRLVNRSLGLPPRKGGLYPEALALVHWNNKFERTSAEVVAAFRQAAQVPAVHHNAHEGELVA